MNTSWFKRLFLFTLLIFVIQTILAQSGQIRGFIYDKANGEPVIYTNVYFKGTSTGTISDVNGYYAITKIPEGNYTLTIRAMGYESFEEEVFIGKNDLITKNIYLAPSIFTLEAVDITAEQEEKITETRISVISVSPKEIEKIPSVGGQSDFAQYLQVIPGIIFTGDQGGQLYIRGGSPIQNKVMMDGMTIFNPFHSIGLFSVFETDLIRSANVYTGGFNANYGGRISSIMDISIRDGNKKRQSGKIQASTFGANLMTEGPLVKMKGENAAALTYVLSAKGSFLEQSSAVLYPYVDTITRNLPFSYIDVYGKMTFSAANGSKFSLFGFYYDDMVNNYKKLVDYRWNTFGGGFNFVVMPERSSTLFEGRVTLSKYCTEMSEHQYSGASRYSDIFNLTLGMDLNYFFGKSDLKWGFEINAGNTNYVYNHYTMKASGLKDNNTEFAVYTKYKGIFGKFIVEPGFRLQWYAALNEFSPEPRLSLKYNITPNLRLKASGGLYSQNLIAAASDRDVVNLFYGFLGSVQDFPKEFRGDQMTSCLQKAHHVVGGIEYDLDKHVVMNLEGYFKNFTQLTNLNRNKIYPTGEVDKPLYERSDFIIEDGKAYGMDFSIKVDYDQLYIWAAYSLAYVDRRDEFITYNPHYDRRHNLNLLATYAWGKARDWEVSARWNFGSGFPYTPVAGFCERLHFEDINFDYLFQNGELIALYGDIYTKRLLPYHRLDLNLKKKFFLGQYSTLELDLGVTNVYNRDNIFYYAVITKTVVNQLPILPSFGLCFRF
ncbi:MAG: TonB-dependent receptor [Bacteroidales bacterium]|jgi:hypothetical protein|nr:TonB-dependent receptor [Bacteroidales bacterium]